MSWAEVRRGGKSWRGGKRWEELRRAETSSEELRRGGQRWEELSWEEQGRKRVELRWEEMKPTLRAVEKSCENWEELRWSEKSWEMVVIIEKGEAKWRRIHRTELRSCEGPLHLLWANLVFGSYSVTVLKPENFRHRPCAGSTCIYLYSFHFSYIVYYYVYSFVFCVYIYIYILYMFFQYVVFVAYYILILYHITVYLFEWCCCWIVYVTPSALHFFYVFFEPHLFRKFRVVAMAEANKRSQVCQTFRLENVGIFMINAIFSWTGRFPLNQPGSLDGWIDR